MSEPVVIAGNTHAGGKSAVRVFTEALGAFDALPLAVRRKLNHTVTNFDPVEARDLVAEYGEAMTLQLIDRANQNFLSPAQHSEGKSNVIAWY